MRLLACTFLLSELPSVSSATWAYTHSWVSTIFYKLCAVIHMTHVSAALLASGWPLGLPGHRIQVLDNIKVTGTSSWIKISMSKTCLFFLPKSYWIFTTTSHYRGHSAIVQPNTNFAIVHSRVTVGGCSVEYEYKFLRQFARIVAHRMPYTSVLSICTTLLQGHTKHFWNKNSPVCRSLFSKSLGTGFSSIQ